jgi:hypothetical protein
MSGSGHGPRFSDRAHLARITDESQSDPAQEEDVRTKQALLTAIVVLILFGIGFWLVQEFHRSIAAHQCLEQGRRNCPAAEIRTR